MMADWSELLPELVLDIAKALTFHEDFASLSNVCSSWKSATTNWDDSDRLPSRYPSLLVVNDDNPQESQIHLFDGTVRKLRFPETKLPNSKLKCLSSTGGWILIIEEDTTDAKLFHPFSRREINLPDLKSVPDVNLEDRFFPNRARIRRVVLSADPNSAEKEQDVVVMVVFGPRGWLGFCKLGDSRWTAVQQGWMCQVEDLCYHEGEAFTFDGRGEILSCDLGSKDPEMLLVTESSLIGFQGIKCIGYDHILPPLDDEDHEKLLVVYHECDSLPYPEELQKKFNVDEKDAKYMIFKDVINTLFWTRSLLVFECDLETGEWAKVTSLGNKAVFVGLSSSFNMEASGCIKPNCIYFTDKMGNKDYRGDAGNVGMLDMGIYHLCDGTMEPHLNVRSLSYNNNPMWIAPPNL